jgi:hypothetical protein
MFTVWRCVSLFARQDLVVKGKYLPVLLNKADPEFLNSLQDFTLLYRVTLVIKLFTEPYKKKLIYFIYIITSDEEVALYRVFNISPRSE